jgi:site-specific recombinase XerD
MQRFCRYLANEWRLQKLSNIAPKHIEAYTAHLKQTGKSPSTIKTDLAAIRFYHDLMSNPRNELPDNSKLNLQRRKILGNDWAWSQKEFDLMIGIATKLFREDYVRAMCLAYYAGLRIHECCRIDTAVAEKAIKLYVEPDGRVNLGKVVIPAGDIISYEEYQLWKSTY